MGVEGISRHLTHDKKFAVLIYPSGGRHFLGVRVGDLKTKSPEPEFQRKQSVTFLRQPRSAVENHLIVTFVFAARMANHLLSSSKPFFFRKSTSF